MGREQKKWDTERQQMLDEINILKKAVANNDSDNSQSSNPTSTETETDPFFQPTGPWRNQDGSINWEAAPQYLLRYAQQQGGNIKDLEKQVTEGLASLRNEVIGIQSESKAAAEAQEWKNKFGILEENYQTFKNLLDTKGQLAAFEYLSLTKKEVDGQRAAMELQEQQRGNVPILNAGTPPVNVKEQENNVEALAKQIAEMPFGPERTNAAYEVSERVDPLTASAVLTRAAELTRAAFNAA